MISSMKKYTRRNTTYKALIVIIIVLLSVLGVSYSPQEASSDETGTSNTSQNMEILTQQIQKLTDNNTRISIDAETGFVSFLGTDLSNAISTTSAVKSNCSPEQTARSFLSGYGQIFGINNQSDELEVLESYMADNNRSFTHFQQVYKDIPILGEN